MLISRRFLENHLMKILDHIHPIISWSFSQLPADLQNCNDTEVLRNNSTPLKSGIVMYHGTEYTRWRCWQWGWQQIFKLDEYALLNFAMISNMASDSNMFKSIKMLCPDAKYWENHYHLKISIFCLILSIRIFWQFQLKFNGSNWNLNQWDWKG